MDEKTEAVIKKTIEELLSKMGFSVAVTISQSDDEDGVICDVAADTEPNLLIGQHGINLQALQHLARLIVRKHIPEKVRFTLDINKYRQQKNQSIIEQARLAASEAISQGRSVFMDPMTTYERRIVHLELSKNSSVSTESVGEGESRKIVVKPANLIE